MNNAIYSELDGIAKSIMLEKIQENYNLGRFMWEDPIKFNYITGGVVYGLEVPLNAVKALSSTFGDSDLYFLYQDMVKPEFCDVSKLSGVWDSGRYPAEISYLWTIENLIIFDESQQWFIQFNAYLSIGIVVFRKSVSPELLKIAMYNYNKYDILVDISQALVNVRDDLSNYGNLVENESNLIKFYSKTVDHI
jgi:hypothetical protein